MSDFSEHGGTDEVRIKLGVDVDVEAMANREFEVVAIRDGIANGYVYGCEVLARAASLFEGVTVFLDHPNMLDASRPGGRSVGEVAGVVSSAWYQPRMARNGAKDAKREGRESAEEGCIRAYLTTGGPRGPLVSDLAAQIVADQAEGLPVPNVGLSADMYIKLAPPSNSPLGRGEEVREVLEITRVVSLDVVFNPAAGGSFERVLNSVQGNPEIAQMKGVRNVSEEAKVKDVLRQGQDGILRQGEDGEQEPGKDGILRQASFLRQAQDGKEVNAGMDEVRATLAELEAARKQAEETAQVQLKLSCGSLLETALRTSTLPLPMKEEIKTQFDGRVFAAEDLTAALDAKASVYAELVESSVIKGMGFQGPVVHGMKNSMERVQAAVNQLFGVAVDDKFKDVPPLSGLRELYIMLTGDYDFHGVFHPERVQLANATTGTMTSVVKNAMNVALLEAFQMRPQWWSPIAHEEDFGTMDDVTWMTLGGFGDLPTVAEGAAYTELTWGDDENVVSFAKKGGYIGLTLEMIDRDRVAAARAIPRKLGLAAWRTVSTLVSELFTSNAGIGPTLTDTGALFNATAQTTAGGHANLLTTALSLDQWDTVVQAMYQLTEQISLKPQGIRPSYCLVPIELEKTALTIFGSPQIPGSANNDINVRTMPADRVITVPEWTDANNWAAVAAPADCQGVCIGYRFGRQPELFVADDTLTGSMFTNDEMRIKARFVVAVGVGNYRGLHKSNVA